MAGEEYLMRLQMIQQEAGQLEEKLQTIDEQISSMEAIKASIKEIDKKDSKEFLANLGKGIFMKAEVTDKNLFVNVGKNTLIKKNPEETIKIIDDQVKKLFLGKEGVMRNIEGLQVEMQKLMQEAQKEQEAESKKEPKKKK